ncbi:hypothetical protein [Rhodoferax sp. GW822-FHT02A01]|uniref:hypothetical protein n=1 Tax=Rhodoferax sp. GW822-FHT02A01 TaxID=3141537 RepID=UPI00315D3030
MTNEAREIADRINVNRTTLHPNDVWAASRMLRTQAAELEQLRTRAEKAEKDAAKWRAVAMLYPGGADALFERMKKIATELSAKEQQL